MVLNDGGKIAQLCCLDIPNHFPHAKLDAFVVMPDHVHGIIILHEIYFSVMQLTMSSFSTGRVKNNYLNIYSWYTINQKVKLYLHITAINDYIDYENLLLMNNVYYNYGKSVSHYYNRCPCT